MARIIGVALSASKKFLGFVDSKGKIRKGKVKRLHNPQDMSADSRSVRTSRMMKTYRVVWSPTGQTIATVEAKTAKAAKRKAPAPYRKYKGEIYVEEV
jgi:hypothetical protein